MGILAFLLNIASAPFVNKVLDYLNEKQKTQQGDAQLKTQITIETIKDALEQQRVYASVTQAEIGSKLLSIPRFLIEMAVAALVIAWTVEAIYPAAQLGAIDPELLKVVTVVIAGMFTLGVVEKLRN